MERAKPGELARRRRIAAALALVSTLLPMASCRGPERSFGALLAKIDASQGDVPRDAFINAAALASGTEERLRLLKRASLRGDALYADTAEAISAVGAVTEPVALAMLDAYLQSSRFDAALALFDGSLDPDERASEYAETLTLAARSGAVYSPKAERLVASADASGDRRFLVYAAVEAMLGGDRATALTLLVDSVSQVGSKAYDVPYRLLWDAGALDALRARPVSLSDPLDIAVLADAEYLLGNRAAASAWYAYLVERYPLWSWKPYAALARFSLAGDDQPRLEWPHAPELSSYAASAAPAAVSARFYDAIAALFEESAEANLERARWLYSQSRGREALALVDRLDGESASIARLEYGAPGRSVPEALRLVAEFPRSPASLEAALAAMARAGAWSEFSELLARSDADTLRTSRSWFWSALGLALEGDATEAAAIIRRYGPESAGYAGAYDLGILELAAHRPERAAEAFSVAASIAGTDGERASAYVMAGDSMLIGKRYDLAKSAYEAAIGSDPVSRIARSRLERLREER